MVDFEFYLTGYQGSAIPDEGTFRPLGAQAERQLRRYRQIYTVTAPEEGSEAMAVCAMADALFRFRQAQTGVVASSSIGSVSTTFQVAEVDVSPRGQQRELYRCACLYLDINRGCG